jgi:hypothetical protein
MDPHEVEQLIASGQATKIEYNGAELLESVEEENNQLRKQNRRLQAALSKAMTDLQELRSVVDDIAKTDKPVHNGRTTKSRNAS